MGRYWLIVCVWTGFLLLTACSQERAAVGQGAVELPAEEDAHEGHDEADQEPPGFVSMDEAEHLGPIKAQAVTLRALSGAVTATGEVRTNPDRLAHLTARLAGWIQEVHAFQDDTVTQGEVLARIDSPEYLTAQTEYLMTLKRSLSPHSPEETATTRALLASARQKLLLLGAWEQDIEALANAGTPQRYLPVRAPWNGTVIESHVVKGNALQPGDTLYRIADLSTLWVILDIVEQDLARVRAGVSVQVMTAAYPNEHFQGALTLLSRTAQEATRTVQARVVVSNPRQQLRPGMFVQGRIEVLGGVEVPSVPASAVFLFQGKDTVFIQTDGGYQATAVQIGRRQGGWVEVLRGVSPATPVVVEGGFSLKAQLVKETLGAGHGH